MTIAAGRLLNDRYRLVRPVGQGAQAAVWVADHLALSTHVAVKLIDPELAKQDDARERFRREATAAAQLRSAHVVQILDHGIDDGQPFIVMELLEGEDLFERIEKLGRLTLKDTSKVVTQVARALARAHSAGIVHRDLKPENVFLVPNEDDEIAKVLDFGVAKVTSPAKITMQRTGVGTLLGTPHYMSPEQVKGVTEVDFRTDLWALGVIAYQCVTGDLPFDSEGVGDLLLKITVGEMPIPSDIVPGLPATFDAWFAKACQRDPAKRFESARDMADALARAVGMADKRPATIPRPIPARAVAAATAVPDSEPPPSSSAPSSRRAKPPPPPKSKPAAAGHEGEPARKAAKPPTPAAGRKGPSSSPKVEVLDPSDLEEADDTDDAAALTPLSLRSQLESTDVTFDEAAASSAAPHKLAKPAAPALSAAVHEAPAVQASAPAPATSHIVEALPEDDGWDAPPSPPMATAPRAADSRPSAPSGARESGAPVSRESSPGRSSSAPGAPAESVKPPTPRRGPPGPPPKSLPPTASPKSLPPTPPSKSLPPTPTPQALPPTSPPQALPPTPPPQALPPTPPFVEGRLTPAPPSARSPDTSRPAHSMPSSTVSGLASPGDPYIPPEFDGSRRRRTLGFVVFGFIALVAAVAWLTVRPYLKPPPPGPAAPPATEAPSAMDSAPPMPMVVGSGADALPSAVDPGRPRAPGSIEPGSTAAPKPKGRWKKKDDVEFVVPDPRPED